MALNAIENGGQSGHHFVCSYFYDLQLYFPCVPNLSGYGVQYADATLKSTALTLSYHLFVLIIKLSNKASAISIGKN